MVCFRRAKRIIRIAPGYLLPRFRRIQAVPVGAGCFIGLLFGSLSASAWASPPPVRADMSLGEIIPPGEAELSAASVNVASALAHYSSALQFEASGKLREALDHYLAVFHADPTNSGLAMHTAELAYSFQGREKAIAILQQATQAAPALPGPYLNLAQFCATYASDDPFEKDRAVTVIQDALRLFPTSAEVYGGAVMMHLTRRQRDEAVQIMNRAAGQSVNDSEYWLQMGRVAQQVWPLGQAETRVENLAHVNPYFAKAVSQAKGANSEQVRLEVAQYYLLTNQLEEARQLCEVLVKTHKNLQARKLLYRLYDALGEKEKALSTLEQVVVDAPNDVEQRKLLASAYEERKNFVAAVPHLEAAIQVGGGQAEDYLALGDLMIRSQLYEKAVHLSERSQRLFPDQAMFHVQAALAQRALEHWDEAVKAFAEATVLAEASQPELLSHRYFFQYGMTLERAGKVEQAGKIFEKSITLTPKDDTEDAATTMNYLGYMWLELGLHLDKAGELIKNANELQPNNAAYLDSLGWWYFKKGEFPRALAELQRAELLIKELQPEDAEIIEHIARVYAAMNDVSKAREYYLKARSLGPTEEKVRKRIEEGIKKLEPKP